MHCSKVPGQGSKWELNPAHSSKRLGMELGPPGGRSTILVTERSLSEQSLFLQPGFSQFIHPEVPCGLTVGAPIAASCHLFSPMCSAFYDVSNIHTLAPFKLSRWRPASTKCPCSCPVGKWTPRSLNRLTSHLVNLTPYSSRNQSLWQRVWNILVG